MNYDVQKKVTSSPQWKRQVAPNGAFMQTSFRIPCSSFAIVSNIIEHYIPNSVLFNLKILMCNAYHACVSSFYASKPQQETKETAKHRRVRTDKKLSFCVYVIKYSRLKIYINTYMSTDWFTDTLATSEYGCCMRWQSTIYELHVTLFTFRFILRRKRFILFFFLFNFIWLQLCEIIRIVSYHFFFSHFSFAFKCAQSIK